MLEYARFADDLGVLVDAHPRQRGLRGKVEKRLREEFAKLGLEVNEEKSRMVNLCKGESFGFLGFEFRRIRSRVGRWRPMYQPQGKKRTARLAQAQKHLSVLSFPTVTPHLTVVMLPLPLLGAVSACVDVLGAWMQPTGAGGP